MASLRQLAALTIRAATAPAVVVLQALETVTVDAAPLRPTVLTTPSTETDMARYQWNDQDPDAGPLVQLLEAVAEDLEGNVGRWPQRAEAARIRDAASRIRTAAARSAQVVGEIRCAWCGQRFPHLRSDAKYCGPTCRQGAYRARQRARR